ncbi:unnamed protein product, partial [marine sediment metagenome]
CSEQSQKNLYKAFSAGDVEGVRQIPRKERKQIFVTSMSIRFVDDIEAVEFDATSLLTGGTIKKRRGEGPVLDERALSELRMFGRATKYEKRFWARPGQMGATVEGAKPGFLATMTGYSPYKNLGKLMDPRGVEGSPSQWGVITRLAHLDDIVDGNSPFELYKKTELEHFRLEIKPVDIDAEIPAGIGDAGPGAGDENVLIDPMTKETISKVAKLDPHGKRQLDESGNFVYEVNDNWFVLNAKFVWKDAPNKKAAPKTVAPTSAEEPRG